jgi:hypothetical protein
VETVIAGLVELNEDIIELEVFPEREYVSRQVEGLTTIC